MKAKRNIKVSVVCITYNHRNYIEQALNGMLMQETSFDYEIIVGDDCSKDGTAEVITRFSENNPDKIIPIIREKNIGIQDNLINLLTIARGDYIALCEGDDFWTDPLKLQMQADFLDSNKACGLVFHPVTVKYENTDSQDSVFPEGSGNFTLERLLQDNYIQTNSVMYRKLGGYQDISNKILPMDWYLHLLHVQFSEIGFIDRNMSVYRVHDGGVWYGSSTPDLAFWMRHANSQIIFFENIMNLYGSSGNAEHRLIIRKRIHKYLCEDLNIIKLKEESPEGLRFVEGIISNHPSIMLLLVEELSRCGAALSDRNTVLEQMVVDLQNAASNSREIVQRKDEYLKQIMESKSYRIGRAITKPYRRLKIMKPSKASRHQ